MLTFIVDNKNYAFISWHYINFKYVDNANFSFLNIVDIFSDGLHICGQNQIADIFRQRLSTSG